MKKSKIIITRLGKDMKPERTSFGIGLKSLIFVSVLFLSIYIFKDIELYLRNIYSGTPFNESHVLTWISSLASFWGGIIGGVISGVLSFLGILFTIRYYRKTDFTNRAIENKPFLNLMVEEVHKSKLPQRLESQYLCEIGTGNSFLYVLISIENIGKNFARTVVYYNDGNFGGYRFEHIVKAGEKLEKEFAVKIKYDENEKTAMLGINFFDCFMNEYIQMFEFSISKDGESVEVIGEYPHSQKSSFK